MPGAPGERDVAEVVRRALAAAGLDVVMQDAAPGRPNVIGVLDGRSPGPTVMFCGHLDTVGVEGMTDPFTPRIERGRLYGRGAEDMKGGVAAMIAAAAELSRRWTRGRLVVAGVADEEHLSLGADALVREWHADMAIVTEPTDLRLGDRPQGLRVGGNRRARPGRPRQPAARKGAMRSRGWAACSSRSKPAIANCARAPEAPFQGTGSLHASIIRGRARAQQLSG